MTHDLNDTLIFVKVVEHGSFVGAAKSLRLPKTTVSRKVQELESRLGAQLLHRTTRKLGLTEAGNVYFEHSQRIARDLNEAESAVNQLQAGPRGWLRFTAPYSIGIDKIAPLLGEFHMRHPEVRVEMILSNEPLDMIAGEIDVALRLGTLPDSSLVARRLGTLHTQVYAGNATSTLRRTAAPDELQYHRTCDAQASPRQAMRGAGRCTAASSSRSPILVSTTGRAQGRAAVRRRPDHRRRRHGQGGGETVRSSACWRAGPSRLRVQRGVPAAHASHPRSARSSISCRAAQPRDRLHVRALPVMAARCASARAANRRTGRDIANAGKRILER